MCHQILRSRDLFYKNQMKQGVKSDQMVNSHISETHALMPDALQEVSDTAVTDCGF